MSKKFNEVMQKISSASILINDSKNLIKNDFDDLTSSELETLTTEISILVEDSKKLMNSLQSTSALNSIIKKSIQ